MIGLTAILGAGFFTSFVSADEHDLTLSMSSLPSLPAASLPPPPPEATRAAPRSVASQPTSMSSGSTPAPVATLPPWVAAALATSPASTSPTALATAETNPSPPSSPGAADSASGQRQTALENQSSGTPTPAAAPAAPLALYQTYTVQAGDTVSGIAARFGVRTEDVVNNNAGVISAGSLLLVGARLQVPTAPGILHNVSVGETLADIADRYGVSLEEIVGFAANRISDPSNVLEGTQILVVNGTPPAAAAPAAREPEATATPEPTPESTPEPTPTAPPKPVYQFIWPLRGNITSFFGPSHPKGIDISVAYQPVAASAAGKVVFVGGDPCCSYGYYIDIQHADGYVTRYAHLSKFLVTLGQQVAQGDTIAISGNTGYSTGAHLHFEIMKNGAVRNPLDFLP